jgi:hypothetical protein
MGIPQKTDGYKNHNNLLTLIPSEPNRNTRASVRKETYQGEEER